MYANTSHRSLSAPQSSLPASFVSHGVLIPLLEAHKRHLPLGWASSPHQTPQHAPHSLTTTLPTCPFLAHAAPSHYQLCRLLVSNEPRFPPMGHYPLAAQIAEYDTALILCRQRRVQAKETSLLKAHGALAPTGEGRPLLSKQMRSGSSSKKTAGAH
jgi:hypothetical protein